MRRPVVGALADERGGVTIITAGSMMMLVASAALAVDVGAVFLAKRSLQGAADTAALYAASASDKRGAAERAVWENGLAPANVEKVTAGQYVPDGRIAYAARFSATPAAGNAARVALQQDVPLFFAGLFTRSGTMHIAAQATAAKVDYAAFSIGSRLASVNGGLPNAILSSLTGSNLSLSLMDYNALAQADINLLTFTKALQTQLNLTGASFGETLDADISVGKAIGALGASVQDPAAAAALVKIAAAAPGTTIRLSDLIDLGPLQSTDNGDTRTNISVSAYATLYQMLQLANGTRQVTTNLGVTVPGVTSTTVTVAIGERPAHSPWLAVSKDGSVIIRTAQARLYLDSALTVLPSAGLLSLRVPIYVELAEASARLSAISCAAKASEASVSLEVLPSVGKAAIADINMAGFTNFNSALSERPAAIAKLPLAIVTGQASTKFGGTRWQMVRFSPSEVSSHAWKTVSTDDLVQGVASSLIDTIDLKASVVGLGLNLSAVTGAVGAALTPAAPALDNLVNQLTGLMGVSTLR